MDEFLLFAAWCVLASVVGAVVREMVIRGPPSEIPRPGKAGPGVARPGAARRGVAGRGRARPGGARQGKAWIFPK